MGKNTSGNGSLRQRANGGWEGRYTSGRDPRTGKQIQRSVYAPTQAECRRKLNEAIRLAETKLPAGTEPTGTRFFKM